MKKFFHANCTNFKDYDAITRRGTNDTDFTFVDKSTKGSTGKEQQPISRAPSFAGKLKSIPLPKSLNIKADSLNTSKHTGDSNSNSGSTTNLFANISNKENEVLGELGLMIEKQKIERNPQLEILRAERDFFYSKLRDIDNVLDQFKDSNVELLMNNIREILYMTPEKIAIVCEDGNIKIKNKSEEMNPEEPLEKDTQRGEEVQFDMQEQIKSVEGNMVEEDLLV